MAYALSIGSVTLSSGSYKFIEYNPGPGMGKESVADRAIISITGANAAARDAAISAITAEFTKAFERRRTGVGSRIYVTFTPDGGTARRSEIWARNVRDLPGRVTVENKFRGAHLWTSQLTTRVIIDFERRGYWEATSETELTLKNNSDSATGGVTIYSPTSATPTIDNTATISFTQATQTIADSGSGFGSFAADDIISVKGSTSNDGVYTVASASAAAIVINEDALTDEVAGDSIDIYHVQNYVTITNTIAGDLKAPLRVTYENTYNDATDVYTIWAGMVHDDIELMPMLLEGEDGTAGTSITDSVVTNAAYSSGQGMRTIWTVDTETEVVYWDLPTSFATACAGRYFKALLVVGNVAFSFADTSRWRGKIKGQWSNAIYLKSGRQVVGGGPVDPAIIDLGDFQIPPWFDDDGTSQPLRFVITCEEATNQDGVIDYVMLLPLQEFRQYTPNTGLSMLSYTETLQDNGLVNQGQVIDTNDLSNGTYALTGSPLMVNPGSDSRLFVACRDNTYGNDTDRTFEIRAYYRPRYSTI